LLSLFRGRAAAALSAITADANGDIVVALGNAGTDDTHLAGRSVAVAANGPQKGWLINVFATPPPASVSRQTSFSSPTPKVGGVTIIVAAIKSIMASLAAQCTFAGTGGLWFLAGILVGTSLGVLFTAIVRMGSDTG